MKLLKLALLVCLAALVTGCSAGQEGNVSQTSVSADESAVKTSEVEQILQLLDDYGDFHRGYMDCRTVKDCVEKSDFVTVERIRGVGAEDEGQPYNEYYYRVSGGGITTEAEMLETMNGFATENYLNNVLFPLFEHNYQISEGNLYLRQDAGSEGTTLGVDHVYLNSVEETDKDTLILELTAVGDKNNWESSEDIVDEFSIIIKRTADGLRIDKCNSFAQGCLADFHVELRLAD